MIDFDKAGGLVPAIAQDADTGDVLMLAWMNREAYEETCAPAGPVYFSRSRGRLWRKGEESGNVQEVREVFIDCDADTILLKVHQIGGAACHEGYQSCFFRQRRGRRAAGRRRARLRSQAGLQEMNEPDPQTRHPGRQPAGGDRRAVPQGRLQDHLRQPQLLSRPSTIRKSTARSIRAQEMPRYVQDGSLDCGLTGYDWILENDAKVVEAGRAGLQQGQQAAGALGAGRAQRLADPERQGPARQAHRHRGRQPDAALAGPARRRGPRRVQLGRHRGQAAAPGRRHRRGDRDRQLAAGQQPAHRRRAAAKHDALHRQRAGLRRSVEEAEDGRPGADAARGDGRRGQGRPDDERPQGRPAGGAARSCRPCRTPTISSLSDPDWVAVNTILDENIVRHIVPQLKQAGARGIVEYPLNKIID